MATTPLGAVSPPFSWKDGTGKEWVIPTVVAENLGLTQSGPAGTALAPPLATPSFTTPEAEPAAAPVDPYAPAPDLGTVGDFASQLKNAVSGAVGASTSMVQDVALAPPAQPLVAPGSAIAGNRPVDETGRVIEEPRAPSDPYEQRTAAVDQATAAQVSAENEAQAFRQAGEISIAEMEKARQAERKQEKYEIDQLSEEQGKALEKAQNHKMGSLWSDSSTGNKALMLIGVALSTIGAARSPLGTKNPALEALLALTDKHTQLKLAERARLDRMAKDTGDRIAQMREFARSSEQLFHMTKASFLGDHERQLDMIIGKSKSEVMKANAETLKASITQERNASIAAGIEAGRKAQLEEREQGRKEFETIEDVKARKAQIGLGYANLRQQQAELEETKAQRLATATTKAEADVIEREVPDLVAEDGSAYQARDGTVGRQVAMKFAATKSLDKLAEDLKRKITKYGNKTAAMQSAEWQEMTALAASIANTMRTAEEMGALDKGAMEQMSKLMGGVPLRDGVGDQILGALYDPRGKPTAGLTQMQSNAVTKFNDYADSMRYARGPKYQPWKPEHLPNDTPIKTKAQEKLQRAIDERTPDEELRAAQPGIVGRTIQKTPGAHVLSGGDPRTNAQKTAESKVAGQAKSDIAAAGMGITPFQREQITLNAIAAKSDDENKSKQGRANLVKLAAGRLDKSRGKFDPVAKEALVQLALVGDEAGLAEIKAKLSAGGKSESEIEELAGIVQAAREDAELRARKPGKKFGIPDAR